MSTLSVRSVFASALGLAAFLAPSLAWAQAYPVKKSSNNRYLVDQNNAPFLIAGDAPQALTVNVSTADADMYFANRASHSFNSLWVNLICTTYTGGRADGSTYDGILPFTGFLPGGNDLAHYDLSKPNEAFFARCDQMINDAASHGLLIFLDPAETGGWLNCLLNNGATACRAYGQFLGNRYAGFKNIVWQSGNDFQSWSTAANDAVVTAVALGIKDRDANHLHTVELNYQVSKASDDPNWVPIIGLNSAYTYFPTYAEVLSAYNATPTMPVFMVEANYEGENDTGNLPGAATALVVRIQEYWTNLSGATGQLYGSKWTWPFPQGWQSNLDTPGAIQMAYLQSVFTSRQWYALVPDQSHAILTAGYGAFSASGGVLANNYVTAAATPDGTLAMAYLPTQTTVTVALSKLSGAVTARWYDPSNGTYTAITGSPFANSGSHNFSSPGNNSEGSPDWLLVLEATPGGPTAPAISTQPVSQTVTAGQTASFTVTATGTAPLSFQWQTMAAGGGSWTNVGTNSQTYSTGATTTAQSGEQVRVLVTNAAGSATSVAVTLTVNPASGGGGGGGTTGPVAVNSGGPAVGSFLADVDFTGGNISSTTATIDTSAVTNPAPMGVYQTERWGNFTYAFSGLTPGGAYTIRLHFAEIYWTGAGQRVFNVAINGTAVLTNFDIFATAGAADKATIQSFPATADGSGQITVAYTQGSTDWPKSSGIEILAGTSGGGSGGGTGGGTGGGGSGGGPASSSTGGSSHKSTCGLVGLEGVPFVLVALGWRRRKQRGL